METIIKASPVKTRRKFDMAFKLEAVRNWHHVRGEVGTSFNAS